MYCCYGRRCVGANPTHAIYLLSRLTTCGVVCTGRAVTSNIIMSRVSDKRRLEADLRLLFSFFYMIDIVVESDDAKLYHILFEVIKHQRYLFTSRAFVLKSNWVLIVLSIVFETRFRSYVRMNRFFSESCRWSDSQWLDFAQQIQQIANRNKKAALVRSVLFRIPW
jgi:hypothetical protein